MLFYVIRRNCSCFFFAKENLTVDKMYRSSLLAILGALDFWKYAKSDVLALAITNREICVIFWPKNYLHQRLVVIFFLCKIIDIFHFNLSVLVKSIVDETGFKEFIQ